MSATGRDGLTRAERAAIRERRRIAWRARGLRGSFGAASPCKRIDPATGAVIDHDVAATLAARSISEDDADGA